MIQNTDMLHENTDFIHSCKRKPTIFLTFVETIKKEYGKDIIEYRNGYGI